MISFDIEKTPPIEQEIEKERTIIRKEKKKIKVLGALSIYFLLPAFPILFWCQFYDAATTRQTWQPLLLQLASTLFIPLVLALYGKHCETKTRKLEHEDSSLGRISQQDCPHMLTLCQTYKEIRLYQNTVATMGRPLTQREFDAANAWVNQNHIKESKERQRQACSMLLQPIS